MSQLRVGSISTVGGANNMSLSANGVGFDNKPIISGQIGTTGTFAATQKIPFDDIWVQRGITYSSTTRRFTVPVSGVYRVTMNPFKLSGGGNVRVVICVNQDTYGTHRGMCYSDVSGYVTLSLDSVIQLSANDYITFILVEGSLYNASSDRFNQFTIERIA